MRSFREHSRFEANAVLRGIALVMLVCVLVLGAPHAAKADDNTVNPQLLPDSSFIYDTDIIELDSADPYYDGQTIQVVGEVVGDMIISEPLNSYCWITLSTTNPESNASISVYLLKSDAEKIDDFGKYGVRGTILQVRGTFHLACSEHDGETDLHAENVSIVSPSDSNPDVFDLNRYIPGAILVFIGLICMFVYYRLKERQR